MVITYKFESDHSILLTSFHIIAIYLAKMVSKILYFFSYKNGLYEIAGLINFSAKTFFCVQKFLLRVVFHVVVFTSMSG
jgi:hypothetical protein